jgi:hypothetical protein
MPGNKPLDTPNTSHRCLATVVDKAIASHNMLVLRGMRQGTLQLN